MTITPEYLASEGYVPARQLPDGRWIGVQKMAYTVGLFVGLDATGYATRFCYPNFAEALAAYTRWSGIGFPPGFWIKEKPSDRPGPKMYVDLANKLIALSGEARVKELTKNFETIVAALLEAGSIGEMLATAVDEVTQRGAAT